MSRTYTINPRPSELGGGWKLTFFEDGEEAGGGVFPAAAPVGVDEFDPDYQTALDAAADWMDVEDQVRLGLPG